MKKFFVTLTFFATALPLLVSAQSTTDSSAQIQNLIQQIAVFQARINELTIAISQYMLQNVSLTQTQIQPIPKVVECTFITGYLYLGLSGNEVLSLQKFLVSQGLLSTDSVTGYFGPLTESAVREFQAKNNIEQTGTVGPLTREAINSASCNIPNSTTSTATTTTYTTKYTFAPTVARFVYSDPSLGSVPINPYGLSSPEDATLALLAVQKLHPDAHLCSILRIHDVGGTLVWGTETRRWWWVGWTDALGNRVMVEVFVVIDLLDADHKLQSDIADPTPDHISLCR